MKDEDCIKISKDILQNVVNEDIGIVNAHRTGNNHSNKGKHKFIKVFTNDGKKRIIKNSKKVLQGN